MLERSGPRNLNSSWQVDLSQTWLDDQDQVVGRLVGKSEIVGQSVGKSDSPLLSQLVGQLDGQPFCQLVSKVGQNRLGRQLVSQPATWLVSGLNSLILPTSQFQKIPN